MGEKRTKGFTLMELMMTLAVIGVILGIAAPSFREFLLNNRITGAANDLHAAFQLARSEAIKRQQPVAVCPSVDPSATPPACRADPTWSDATTQSGVVLWVDTNNDGTPTAGELVVTPQHLLSSALTVRSNISTVTYQPTGFADVPGNPPLRVVLLCDERSNQQVGTNFRKRVISISRTGRAEVLKDVTAVTSLGDAALVTCP
jgi:type IV fimbrial biogenesis protein FimT